MATQAWPVGTGFGRVLCRFLIAVLSVRSIVSLNVYAVTGALEGGEERNSARILNV
jgi:hypothetical protein